MQQSNLEIPKVHLSQGKAVGNMVGNEMKLPTLGIYLSFVLLRKTYRNKNLNRHLVLCVYLMFCLVVR